MQVKIPEFELVGPKCKDADCDGVLVLTMSLKSGKFYYNCNKCDKTFTLKEIEPEEWEGENDTI